MLFATFLLICFILKISVMKKFKKFLKSNRKKFIMLGTVIVAFSANYLNPGLFSDVLKFLSEYSRYFLSCIS